jgi:phenylalanyl-tRNA synthetase beta chain
VAASKSALFEYLKDMIVPTHLQLLAENVQEAYPQNIFEVAEVFTPDPSAEAGVKEDLHLAVALSDNAASFTDARSVLDTILLKTFAAKATYRRSSLPFLVEGRTAECLLDDRPIGFVGEVDPKVIIGFGLRAPVSVFEISLSSFFDKVAIKERV